MHLNYRVYVKPTSSASWRDTGIIESNKELAQEVWVGIVKRLRYHSFKLETIGDGTPIDRSGE
jgi:hypothetical protein